MEKFYNFYLLIFTIFLTLSISEEAFNKDSDLIDKHERDLLTLRINESINREKEERDRIHDEMISAIKSKNFARADSLIPEIGSNLIRINLIVMIMYENDNSTFPVLIEYAGKTQNDDVAYHIIDELYVRIIGMTNIIDRELLNKLSKIYEMFIKRILPSQINEDHKVYVNSVIESSLTPKIMREATILLKQNQHNATFYEILNTVYVANETLVDLALVEFINATYTDSEFRFLLNTILYIEWIPQRITALTAFYWRLTRYTNNKGELTLKIAYQFMLLKKSDEYKNSMEDEKKKIERCIDHMPTSVQLLYFSRKVCFRNIHNRPVYYLKATDEHTAEINTETDPVSKLARCWSPENIDISEFRFKNIKQDNQYLYADTEEPGFWQLGRKVLTLTVKNIDHEATNDNLIWQIKLYPNELTIVNKKYKTSICSCFNSDSDVVLAEPGGMDTRCGWVVRSCD